MLRFIVDITVFIIGFLCVALTFSAAVRTVVMPRSERVWLTRLVFTGMRRVFFEPFVRKANSFERRDNVMAYYAPMSLLVLIVAWLAFTTLGFTMMMWATGVRPWMEAYYLSASSLLTLGFQIDERLPEMVLSFASAAFGLIYVALAVAYLPTMYTAFSKREMLVNMLEVRAGAPPSPSEMLLRFHRLKRFESLHGVWVRWEEWFVELEETHTSLPMLVFFRSPAPRRHWLTAAGVVMDTAALMVSAVDIDLEPDHRVQAQITLRAGFIALREIADFFGVDYDPDPAPDDPISISREEFEEVLNDLEDAGVPIITDRNQAWRDFNGWRVNYDTVLITLASTTMAPYAPWISDRSVTEWRREQYHEQAPQQLQQTI